MPDSIPLFVKMVKSNMLLSKIITGGSFTNVNLQAYKYESFSPKCIVLYDFYLDSNKRFDEVIIRIAPDVMDPLDKIICINFSTKNPEYFQEDGLCFGDGSGPEGSNISGNERHNKKKLGMRKIFGDEFPWANVVILSNPLYGFNIELRFTFKRFYAEQKNACGE